MRWEAYEIWTQSGERWELVAWFHDFDVARAVAAKRRGPVRLVHAVSEAGTVKRDTLAEIGAVREQP
jgi:hypothetical protein